MPVTLSSLPLISSSYSDWINYATYSLMAVVFISNIKLEKKTLLTLLIRFLVAFALYIGIDVLIRTLTLPFNVEDFPLIDTITAYLSYFATPLLVSVIGCWLIKDERFPARIIHSSLLLTSWMLLPSISFYISNFMNSYEQIIFILPRLLIMIALCAIVKVLNFNKYVKYDIWPLLIFESFIVIEIVITSIQNINFNLQFLNTLSFLIWIVELFVYFFFYMFLKTSNEKYEKTIENQKLKNDIKLMDFMRTNYENMRVLKHDMKNQYSYIATLYEKGQDEEAKKFFSQMSIAANDVLNFASTGNNVLDITMNMAIQKSKDLKVDFDYACACPDKTPFQDSDFFSLLINILDNAIEGTNRNKVIPKKVTCRIYVSANYLIIDILNTIDGDEQVEKTNGKTSKVDQKSHGYGRKIISSIINKYDGYLVTSIKDNIYEMKVMLALQDEKTIKKECHNAID